MEKGLGLSETNEGFRFCDSPDCDVVYSSEDGKTVYSRRQIRVAVGVKETSGVRPLCYCFDHSIDSIKEQIRSQGESTALRDIRQKLKDPGCRCETENPSGRCCLGSVTKGIRIAREELQIEGTYTQPKPSTPLAGHLATLGTVVSALLASSCCWLPLALVAFGISSAGIASTLEQWRPMFITLTAVCLGSAFSFAYRPGNQSSEGSGCCSSEADASPSCPAPALSASRWILGSSHKIVLWVVAVLAVGVLFFPNYVGMLSGKGEQPSLEKTMRRSVVRIDGMTCEGCSTTVATALRKVPGVLAVEVSFEQSRAVVGTKADQPVPRQAILDALRQQGYEGVFLETTVPSGIVRD